MTEILKLDASYKARLLTLVFSVTLLAGPAAAIGIVESPCVEAPAFTIIDEITKDMLANNQRVDKKVILDILATSEFQAFAEVEQARHQRDWANLCKYKAANEAWVKQAPEVVFMGDSITENWVIADPAFFTNGRIGRGISGQTTPQMLVRFYADVIALKPKVVHIMAGTNDLAGNTGPSTLQDYKNNILAMVDLATLHDIKVILAGIPPVSTFIMLDDHDPRPVVNTINSWLQELAAARRLTFVDYAVVLADEQGSMKDELTNDEVHPTQAGYAVMRPVTEQAILQALAK